MTTHCFYDARNHQGGCLRAETGSSDSRNAPFITSFSPSHLHGWSENPFPSVPLVLLFARVIQVREETTGLPRSALIPKPTECYAPTSCSMNQDRNVVQCHSARRWYACLFEGRPRKSCTMTAGRSNVEAVSQHWCIPPKYVNLIREFSGGQSVSIHVPTSIYRQGYN